ncbi:MAG: hypothetical protein MUO19_01880 [Dehalococcoidales bacterium]|nr:hypothetical protein [Dehalococcoidales bacterium]
MSARGKDLEKKCHLTGWILFVICAGFFIASAVKAQDFVMIAGSVIFLVGCMVFLVPFLVKTDRSS